MVRAVIYCRVSTEDEIQLNALENQMEEAKQAVLRKEWILVDQYIDEGKSGTTTKNRTEYNRLFTELDSEKFDVVVVKSQDRLMRSPKDWYVFIDRLLQCGKKLFFYLEDTFYSTDDSLLTGIKAILAEEYSRDLSKKINNAHRNRQRNKGTVLLTSNTWGYDKVGKQVVINENEAEIVRLMYNLCAEGYGAYKISNILTQKGIFSRSGKPFSQGVIRRIIRNPLFKGTSVMNKRHFDFNMKKTIYVAEKDWVWNEGAVPPIISEELWNKANEQMDQNLKLNKVAKVMESKRGSPKRLHPFSGKMVCGLCGEAYWHTQYKRVGGEVVHVWSCAAYVRSGRKREENPSGCNNVHINQESLEEVLANVAKKFYMEKNNLLEQAMLILRKVIQPYDDRQEVQLKNKLSQLRDKREKLLDAFLEGILEETLYTSKDRKLSCEELEMQKALTLLEEHKLENASVDVRITALKKEIESIMDNDLALNFLYNHIVHICVFPEELEVVYDVFPSTMIKRTVINHMKVIYDVVGDENDESRNLL